MFTCVLFGWQCVVYVPVVDAVCCGQISRVQGMKADTGTLMALCEKTDNDIRSCINTLQVCVCVCTLTIFVPVLNYILSGPKSIV